MIRAILLALVGLVAVLVLAVLLLRPEPPPIPRDSDHATRQQEKSCLGCHGPGERNPRKPTHPNASDCFRCHAWGEPR